MCSCYSGRKEKEKNQVKDTFFLIKKTHLYFKTQEKKNTPPPPQKNPKTTPKTPTNLELWQKPVQESVALTFWLF